MHHVHVHYWDNGWFHVTGETKAEAIRNAIAILTAILETEEKDAT